MEAAGTRGCIAGKRAAGGARCASASSMKHKNCFMRWFAHPPAPLHRPIAAAPHGHTCSAEGELHLDERGMRCALCASGLRSAGSGVGVRWSAAGVLQGGGRGLRMEEEWRNERLHTLSNHDAVSSVGDIRGTIRTVEGSCGLVQVERHLDRSTRSYRPCPAEGEQLAERRLLRLVSRRHEVSQKHLVALPRAVMPELCATQSCHALEQTAPWRETASRWRAREQQRRQGTHGACDRCGGIACPAKAPRALGHASTP